MKKLRNKFFDHFGLANEDAFGDWKDHIEKYDTVLISDDIRGTDIVGYCFLYPEEKFQGANHHLLSQSSIGAGAKLSAEVPGFGLRTLLL